MSSCLVTYYEFGSFRVDMQRYLLLQNKLPLPLPPKAFKTLLVLLQNRDRVVKKEELLNAVWPDSYVEESNLAQNIFVLRKTLRDERTDHKYIVTIPGTGYRFVEPVNEICMPEATISKEISAITAGTDSVSTIAVMPFRSFGDDESDGFLGLGLADAVVTRLSNVEQLRVRPTFSVLKYRDLQADPVLIGRELKVDSLVYGVFQRDGQQVRVSVQLVRVQDGATLWAATFDESFTNIFSIQDSISEQVAQALTLKLGGNGHNQLKKNHRRNTEAFQLYVKGRYFWNQRTAEALKRGINYAKQAIAIEPTYAHGYIALADSYNLLASNAGLIPRETFPKAKAAAMQALEIDDELPGAYASLGFTNYRFEWDWKTAEKNFRRAIGLKPDYATAHQWYGECLACMGRFDESLAELKTAYELDPLSLPVDTDLAQTLFFCRRYAECIDRLREAVEMDPRFIRAHILLGTALVQVGIYDEAVAEFVKAVALSGRDPFALAGLGHAYACSGNTQKAQEILSELKTMSKRSYLAAYNIALIYTGLGDNDSAFNVLDQAVEQRDVWLVWLKVNPRFDSLRGDRRFSELVRSVGLIPDSYGSPAVFAVSE